MGFYQVWKPVRDGDDLDAFLSRQIGAPFIGSRVSDSDGCVLVETTESVPSNTFLQRLVEEISLYPDLKESPPDSYDINVFGARNDVLGRIRVGSGLYVGDCQIQVCRRQALTSVSLTEGLAAQGEVKASKLSLQTPQGTSGVTLNGPSAGGQYDLKMPDGLPASSGCFVAVAPSGDLTFEKPPLNGAVTSAFNSGATITGCKVYVCTVATSSTTGEAIAYPTTTGTASGDAIFTTILHATACAVSNTTSAVQTPWAGLRSVAADRKSVSFNVVMGTPMLLGGNSVVAAPKGTQVQVLIFGM